MDNTDKIVKTIFKILVTRASQFIQDSGSSD